MNPGQNTDDLDAKLKEEESALAKLRVTVQENKEASQELEKSLSELEAATEKPADKDK
jgi:hypothetical protein